VLREGALGDPGDQRIYLMNSKEFTTFFLHMIPSMGSRNLEILKQYWIFSYEHITLNLKDMAEKFYVTNYERAELISMIREAFSAELAEILVKQEKESDYDQLLSRKEAAEMLKVSLVTISKYQKEGRLTFYRIGRHVYFKKDDIMQALEDHMK
jgi:excisionase family DNA binding protein